MSLIDIDIPPTYNPHTSSVRRSKSVGHSMRRPKQKKYVPDPIDKLDTCAFGGFYHHGGPFDAARPSFNLNPKYAPLAAVKESNKAAWAATPREAQLDTLIKGRPLDGVAFVPPGHRAMNGQIMDYEEGTDMMRDLNPGGGAYKRWPGLEYDPNDLKGKGEPGYTIDKKRKAAEAAARANGNLGRSQSVRDNGSYEMAVPRSHRRIVSLSDGAAAAPAPMRRQRSSSASEALASGSRPAGSQFKEGLKRRLGSMRRKS